MSRVNIRFSVIESYQEAIDVYNSSTEPVFRGNLKRHVENRFKSEYNAKDFINKKCGVSLSLLKEFEEHIKSKV